MSSKAARLSAFAGPFLLIIAAAMASTERERFFVLVVTLVCGFMMVAHSREEAPRG